MCQVSSCLYAAAACWKDADSENFNIKLIPVLVLFVCFITIYCTVRYECVWSRKHYSERIEAARSRLLIPGTAVWAQKKVIYHAKTPPAWLFFFAWLHVPVFSQMERVQVYSGYPKFRAPAIGQSGTLRAVKSACPAYTKSYILHTTDKSVV